MTGQPLTAAVHQENWVTVRLGDERTGENRGTKGNGGGFVITGTDYNVRRLPRYHPPTTATTVTTTANTAATTHTQTLFSLQQSH